MISQNMISKFIPNACNYNVLVDFDGISAVKPLRIRKVLSVLPKWEARLFWVPPLWTVVTSGIWADRADDLKKLGGRAVNSDKLQAVPTPRMAK